MFKCSTGVLVDCSCDETQDVGKGNVFCTKEAELKGLGRCVLPFFTFTAQNNFVFYVTEYWIIEFVNNAVGHLFKNVNE